MIPVCLSAVAWDFPLVGRSRKLAEAWSELGVTNALVEGPSVRASLARWRRLQAAPIGRTAGRTAIVSNGFGPLALAQSRRSGWSAGTARRSGRSLRSRLSRTRMADGADFDWERAIALVVHPSWEPLLAELPFGTVLYDCIDEIAVHARDPDTASRLEVLEERLIARADGIIATAESLAQRALSRRASVPVGVIRNGVDFGHFQRVAEAASRPDDLPPAGRPLIGFVGALYEWIDTELIDAVVSRYTDLEFVFVGPVDGRSDLSRVQGRPNVTLLGARPHECVPAYVEAFDVCWVPFKLDAISEAANPVKIYEYLARGKPVVSTKVADLDSFEGLVRAATTAREVGDLIGEALAGGGADAPSRIAFAEANSWVARAEDVLRFVRDSCT